MALLILYYIVILLKDQWNLHLQPKEINTLTQINVSGVYWVSINDYSVFTEYYIESYNSKYLSV